MMGEKVTCPNCGKRLFDVDESAMGGIYIKCQICKNIIKVKIEYGRTCVNNISTSPIPSKGVKRKSNNRN